MNSGIHHLVRLLLEHLPATCFPFNNPAVSQDILKHNLSEEENLPPIVLSTLAEQSRCSCTFCFNILIQTKNKNNTNTPEEIVDSIICSSVPEAEWKWFKKWALAAAPQGDSKRKHRQYQWVSWKDAYKK